MRSLLKWFVRIGLVAAALGCLAFTPLALFVGIMATDSVGITGFAPLTIAIALFIMALPGILCWVFFIALGWVERHPKYLAPMAVVLCVLFGAAASQLPASTFAGMPELWHWFLRWG